MNSLPTKKNPFTWNKRRQIKLFKNAGNEEEEEVEEAIVSVKKSSALEERSSRLGVAEVTDKRSPINELASVQALGGNVCIALLEVPCVH